MEHNHRWKLQAAPGESAPPESTGTAPAAAEEWGGFKLCQLLCWRLFLFQGVINIPISGESNNASVKLKMQM